MYALLDEDQRDLRSLARSIAESIGVAQPADLDGVDRVKGWETLSESGLLELRRHDPRTGPTASGVEIMVVAEALGAHLSPHPYAATVLASDLLTRADADGRWAADAPADRELALLLAPDLAGPTAGEGYVWGSAQAETAVGYDTATGSVVTVAIAPRTEDSCSADLTQGLWAVTPGEVEVVGTLSADGLAAWQSLAMVTVCADTIGVLRQGLDDVVTYTKERIAFGVPVGSFQAVQHLSADVLVALESASAATSYAAWCVDAETSETALLAAHTAKARVASMARDAGEVIMQIYGGIGQTWEHVAHFRTRRALLDTTLFGDETHHLDAIAHARLGGN